MKRKEKNIKQLIDTADVISGFNFWYDRLLAFCLSMFEYKNLPKTLNSYEIESNLILTGHCTIFESDGEIITNQSALFGNDLYLQPTNATTAVINRHNPTLRINHIFNSYGQKGKNAITFYNSILKEYTLGLKTDSSLNGFISRYARQLADIDSTISIYTVSIRDTYIPTSDDSKTKESLLTFYNKRALGKRAIVSDNSIVPLLKSIDISSGKNVKDGLNDLLIARDKILESFYRDIGVKFYNPKKAQVGKAETEANNNLLLINTADLYNARIKGIDEVNSMFKTNIEVDFSESFKRMRDNATESEVK